MADKNITLRVHGLAHQKDRVDARVFALKLGLLVRTLIKSDRQRHGKSSFEFVLTDLKIGSAMAQISERQASTKIVPSHSSIAEIYDVISAVYQGRARELNGHSNMLGALKTLSSGVSKSYSHIEIYIDDDVDSAIRVDKFFGKQVETAFSIVKSATETQMPRQFRGTSHSTFDGILKAVDLRGAVQQATLILTAGGLEIDCICKDTELLRRVLDHRSRVTGIVFYDGTSALPVRMEITSAKLVGNYDLKRWKKSFNIPEFEDGDEWGTE